MVLSYKMSKSKKDKKEKKLSKLLKKLDKINKNVSEIKKMDVDKSSPADTSEATPANVTPPPPKKKNSEDSENSVNLDNGLGRKRSWFQMVHRHCYLRTLIVIITYCK